MTIRRTAPAKDVTAVSVALFIERRRSAADAAHAAGSVVATTTPDGVVVTVAGPAPVSTPATATADAVAERIRATRM